VQHDLALLPHFLRHYLELGIAPSHVHLVLNAPRDDIAELSQAQSLLDAHDIEPAEVWIAPYTSGSMWTKRREVQQRLADPGDWVISADVDEFHEYPDALPAFLAYCERKEVECVQGVFVDRLAADGCLNAIASEPSVWEQFPVEADVACTLRRGGEDPYWHDGTVNVMACRGDLLPGLGGHDLQAARDEVSYLFGRPLSAFPWITHSTFRFALPLRVHHFKWVDTLLASLRERLATPGASHAGSAYGRLLLNYFDREGRIVLDEVPVKQHTYLDAVPWRMRIEAFHLGASARSLLRTAWKRIRRWKP
jgi:hypothetical protein